MAKSKISRNESQYFSVTTVNREISKGSLVYLLQHCEVFPSAEVNIPISGQLSHINLYVVPSLGNITCDAAELLPLLTNEVFHFFPHCYDSFRLSLGPISKPCPAPVQSPSVSAQTHCMSRGIM